MLAWKKTSDLLLLLVLVVVQPVVIRGDFGLNVTVPNLSQDVVSAIDQGVIPLIKANGTINPVTLQDSSGAIGTLIEVVNKIVSPLNSLLGGILGATGEDGQTESAVIFDHLKELAERSRESFGEAQGLVTAGLVNVVKPLQSDQIVGNVSSLGDLVGSVKESLEVLRVAVDQVKNSVDPVTSDNVSSVITADMVGHLLTPLGGISSNLKDLASLVTAVVNDKNLAVNYQTLANTSFVLAQTNFHTVFVTALTRSISDANTNIGILTTRLKMNVKQVYAGLLSKPQVSQRTDSFNLTANMDALEKATDEFMLQTNQSLTMVQTSIDHYLRMESQIIVDMLVQASQAITNLGSASEKLFANRCVQGYGLQLTLAPVSSTRLAACSRQETTSTSALTTIVQLVLDQAKQTIGSISDLVNTCSIVTDLCIDTVLSAAAELNVRYQQQLQLAQQMTQREAHTVETKVRNCGLTTRADIHGNVQAIVKKFENCLQTGL